MRIICCGSLFRGDDRAGLLVAEQLHQLGIEAFTCTGEATDLLHAMTGAQEVVIVDAVIAGAAAGTIHEWHDATTEFQRNSSTTHALGVADGIALARVLGRLPERLHIYCMEAKVFDVGREVSAEVKRAAYQLAQRIADFVFTNRAGDQDSENQPETREPAAAAESTQSGIAGALKCALDANSGYGVELQPIDFGKVPEGRSSEVAVSELIIPGLT